MDMEKLLIVEDEEFPAIARLIELGRQKSYVTLDDILHFFPEAEQDVQHQPTSGISGVDGLGNADEWHVVLVEDFD